MNRLSSKEKLLLQFMLEEKSSNDIANYMKMSLLEIDDVRKSIYQKLEVKSPVSLTKKAFELGLFKPKK